MIEAGQSHFILSHTKTSLSHRARNTELSLGTAALMDFTTKSMITILLHSPVELYNTSTILYNYLVSQSSYSHLMPVFLSFSASQLLEEELQFCYHRDKVPLAGLAENIKNDKF